MQNCGITLKQFNTWNVLGEIGFGEWSVWSACNETCGPGQHTRSRECTIPNPGDSLCQGITNQTEECNLVPCPSMY